MVDSWFRIGVLLWSRWWHMHPEICVVFFLVYYHFLFDYGKRIKAARARGTGRRTNRNQNQCRIQIWMLRTSVVDSQIVKLHWPATLWLQSPFLFPVLCWQTMIQSFETRTHSRGKSVAPFPETTRDVGQTIQGIADSRDPIPREKLCQEDKKFGSKRSRQVDCVIDIKPTRTGLGLSKKLACQSNEHDFIRYFWKVCWRNYSFHVTIFLI